MLTDLQRSNLWEFIRGEAVMEDFEAWLYADDALEAGLGEILYRELISCDFDNDSEVSRLLFTLRTGLAKFETCGCALNHRFAVYHGANYFEDGYPVPEIDQFFASLLCVAEIELSGIKFQLLRCKKCKTSWLLKSDPMDVAWGAMALTDDDIASLSAGRWNTGLRAFQFDVDRLTKVDDDVPPSQNSFVPVAPRQVDFTRLSWREPLRVTQVEQPRRGWMGLIDRIWGMCRNR